jgi:hypothetical protein
LFATVMAIGRAFFVRAGEPDLDKLFSAASNHWIRQISYASSDLAHLGSSLVRGKREFAVDQIRRAPHARLTAVSVGSWLPCGADADR